MRRSIVIFLVLTVITLAFAVHEVWTLLTLLIFDGSGDAITKSELPAPGSDRVGNRTQIIPKIIHQTYKNESIPEVWQDAQRSCIDYHPSDDGWEYKMWTDEMASDFIRTEYPWFEETFEGYSYPIQRADTIRYFVLAHMGGIYIDLDDGCNRRLEPLLSYPAWVRKTLPTGISNDVMGAVPGHPFFMRVIDRLQDYDRGWIMPYITVMATTGPLFLSIMWRHWSSEGLNAGDDEKGGRIRILFPEEYQNKPWSFFTHHLGDSWHAADSDLIFWMSDNWILLTVIGFIVGFATLFIVWWTYQRVLLSRSEVDVPKWKTASIKSRFPFWRRARAQKEYELVSRHEI